MKSFHRLLNFNICEVVKDKRTIGTIFRTHHIFEGRNFVLCVI